MVVVFFRRSSPHRRGITAIGGDCAPPRGKIGNTASVRSSRARRLGRRRCHDANLSPSCVRPGHSSAACCYSILPPRRVCIVDCCTVFFFVLPSAPSRHHHLLVMKIAVHDACLSSSSSRCGESPAFSCRYTLPPDAYVWFIVEFFIYLPPAASPSRHRRRERAVAGNCGKFPRILSALRGPTTTALWLAEIRAMQRLRHSPLKPQA